MSSTKKLVLYGDEASPPVRFVLITASLLDVYLEFSKVDIFKGENKTESYKKINPLQKVPALAVNDEMLCDSHAIALYLCRSSKNNYLYPEDTILRSRIDELMYYNSNVLFPIDSAIFTEFFACKWPADEVKLKNWDLALDYLESKLNRQKFLTGDEVRLCDVCCSTTVSSLDILIPISERHKKVREWLKNLNSLSSFEINTRGLLRLRSYVEIIRP